MDLRVDPSLMSMFYEYCNSFHEGKKQLDSISDCFSSWTAMFRKR